MWPPAKTITMRAAPIASGAITPELAPIPVQPLVSIIQGVALFFLTDSARAVLSKRHWGALLYVAAGLCVIFIFWSRSVIHTLTLIKWPLEFGHNFFYIACALGEAILFSRLDS